jgi:hypothetical protein
MKKNKKTILIIVIAILVIGLIVGLAFGLDKIQNLFGQASGQEEPQGIRVTNTTANSATIVWQTGVVTTGQIEYGTTPGSFLLRAAETTQSANHNLTLSPLLPETIYYFRIRIGDKIYDDGGAPYSFTTKSIAETVTVTPTPLPTVNITATPIPTAPSSSATGQKTYTLGDFVGKFGTADPEFDINNDGVVNSQDWSLYQQI